MNFSVCVVVLNKREREMLKAARDFVHIVSPSGSLAFCKVLRLGPLSACQISKRDTALLKSPKPDNYLRKRASQDNETQKYFRAYSKPVRIHFVLHFELCESWRLFLGGRIKLYPETACHCAAPLLRHNATAGAQLFLLPSNLTLNSH